MKRLLITTPTFAIFSDAPLKLLLAEGLEVVRAKQPVSSGDDLLEYLEDTVAIITGLEPISEKVIFSAPQLKVIAKHGAGVDNINLIAAKKKGVTVVNASGINREAVADLVFGLAIALAREIPKADRIVKSGQWPKMIGQSVWGSALGIIGFGVIGKSLAKRAQGFNMRVLANDPLFDKKFAEANNIEQATVAEILTMADFITIHVPLTNATKSLIGRKELNMMKPSAYLINTARGGVIDEEALGEALRNGTIAGAALDVFYEEPPRDSSLLGIPNLIATPHLGGYTKQALNSTSQFTAEMVLEVLRGGKPPCIIV